MKKSRLFLVLLTYFSMLSSITYADITGTVFIDFNLDGEMYNYDSALSGASVKGYCSDGSTPTAITDINGSYTLETTADCIVEVDASDVGYYSGANAEGSAKTLVELVSNGSEHNVSVASPSSWSQGEPGIIVAAAPGRYYYDSEEDSIHKIEDYQLLGTIFYGPMPEDGDINNKDNRKILATQKETGAVWGLAYARESKKIYSSAVIRRLTFSPENNNSDGSSGVDLFGGIYVTDISNGLDNPTTERLVLIDNSEIGYNLDITQAEREDDIAKDHATSDINVSYYSARAGFGDLDISEDEKYLYTVNMGTKELYKIEIANPNNIEKYSIVNPYSGECEDEMVRPWAIKVKGDNVFVGSVCENQIENDVGAIVQKFDGQEWTLFAKTGSLQYNKEPGVLNLDDDADRVDEPEPWKNWEDLTAKMDATAEPKSRYPILSDIEFDNNGDLILGFIDRGSLNTLDPYNGGDLRRMCKTDNGDYVDESNELATTECPSHRYEVTDPDDNDSDSPQVYYEFYPGEFFDVGEDANETNPIHGHHETSLGGVAQEPGTAKVAISAIDVNGWTQPGGFLILANSEYTGSDGVVYDFGYKVSSMVIVDNDEADEKDAYFRKSGGFGDVELLLDLAPIEIGNYVWYDKNGNGIQDADETPIENVLVTLYEGDSCSGTKVAEVNTTSDGYYYFGGPNSANMLDGNVLKTSTEYTICISLNDEALDGKLLTINDVNNNEDDNRDSDGIKDDENAFITFTTTNFNDHTFDFGFYEPASVGDYVWIDENEDGVQDSTEEGVANVEVILYDENGTEVARTTTDSNGKYLFEDLVPADYKVKFNLDTLPDGYVVTQANQGSDDSVDSDANTTTGECELTTLEPGESDLNWDMGIYKPIMLEDDEKIAKGGEVVIINLLENDDLGVDPLTIELIDPKSNEPTLEVVVDGEGVWEVIPGTGEVKFTPEYGFIDNPTPIEYIANDIYGNELEPALITIIYEAPNLITIGDFIWYDKNINGIQDEDEEGVVGVKVILYDSNGNRLQETISDNDGYYKFDNIEPYKDYIIKFELPNNYMPTLQNQGSDALDSDANKEAIIEVNPSSDNLTLDIGIYCECEDWQVNSDNYDEVSASSFNILGVLLALLSTLFFATRRENNR